MNLWVKVVSSVSAILLVRAVFRVQKLRRSINYFPANYFLFGFGNRIAHILLPPIQWFTHGANLDFLWKFMEYERLGVDSHATISILSPGAVLGYKIADPDTVKQIVAPRAPFRKPAEKYTPLLIFGPNIVASEGEQWKKYKKIVGPAFSEGNNKLIWNTSVKIMLDLFDDVWGEQQTIDVEHGADLTLAMTLLVLGSGVFGMETTWTDRAVAAPGHTLGFQECLRIVSMNLKARVVTPKWAYSVSKKLKVIDVAFTEMEQYIREMIQERSSSTTQKSYDLLSSLIEYNRLEDASSSLNDRELIGNIFMIMSAGHETSAHTLCFALALLAMYPDEQDALYEHVKSILPKTGVPDYSYLPRLKRCHAVLNETLRLFPAVGGIPKLCTEDTTLTTSNRNGEKIAFPVPKGTMMSIVPPALHHNPKYWPDPYKFNPDRFMGDWPRDAFIPFSVGAQSCLGRRFFETEATAILALLISRYKVSIKEEPQFAGESFEQKKARIFRTKHLLSLTPVHVPLVFTRRS